MDGVVLSAKVPAALAESVRAVASAEDRSVSSVVRRSLALVFDGVEPLADIRIGDGDASRFEIGDRKETHD